MAAHDTHTSPPGLLAALVGVSPADLAEARAVAALREENAALRRALETATADIARAHAVTVMVVGTRNHGDALRTADAALSEQAAAHRDALHALETIGQPPAPQHPGTVIPSPGRQA